MKTAISLPDSLYHEAEHAARFLNIPRSRLYTLALTEYLTNHANSPQNITKRLDAVYAQTSPETLSAGLEAARKLTKNDAW
ncbi:MAG: ChpI protein [Candidatus Margulisbacteria bacterium]|jgi:hypothetical protein|nr:ChpI protein [Candidatus Margulisiibacteriota bacterium]